MSSQGRTGGLGGEARPGILGSAGAAWLPRVCCFSSSRPGEAAPKKAQISRCQPLFIPTGVTRYL